MSEYHDYSQPDLSGYEWVVVNSSGGKDSQTALRTVVITAQQQRYPLSQVVVSHQELGKMEWEGTTELVYRQAAHYGLRVMTSRYRDKHGEELSLLDGIRRRGKWPSSKARYCTSEWKRGAGNRVLVQLSRERPGPILQVFGFRAEESTSRAKKVDMTPNQRASSGSRPVTDWLPILHWTEEQVWADIKHSQVPYHPAYDLGMPRLSCAFCVFAPKGALMVAAQHNPELFQDYLAAEREMGHDFQHKKPLRSIAEALARGETPPPTNGVWNM